jgi:hypothetical protein
MTMRVYSPDAGIPVRMKVEDPNDPTKSVETEDMTTVANAWETLEFDFSNEAPGTAAINFTYIYKKCSVFFNFGTTGAVAGAKTYYFDDVRFSGSIMVTFQVQVGDAVPVYIFGGWNNWANWPGTPMVAMGGNIYTVSVPMAGNQAVEYLFVSGTDPVKEVLDPSWPCTNGNTQYTNRLTSMASNDTTMCVKWATCESCTFTSVGDLSEQEMKISLLDNGIRLSSSTIIEANQIEVFDLMGRMIYSSTQGWKMNTLIPVKFSAGGIYVVRIKADNKLFSHKGLLIK